MIRVTLALAIAAGCAGSVEGGGGASDPPQDDPGTKRDMVPVEGPFIEARVWRLTRAEYDRTVADLLGDTSAPGASFVQEPGGTGYANAEQNLGLSSELMDQVSRAAERLARETLADPSRARRLHDCLPGGADDEKCVSAFVTSFGRRAFRRPLTGDEVSSYLAFWTKHRGGVGGAAAVQLIVEAMLQSPHFLFRTEVGAGAPDARGRVTLTPHETAASLSYYLTGTTPDAELSAAADSGAITRPAELERQARRLLGSERARVVVWDLFRQLAGYDALVELTDKAGPSAAAWKSAKRSLAKETEAFVLDLVFNDDAAFGKLFTAPHTFVDKPLAKLYGLPEPPALTKVPVSGPQRAGLLTHAGLMSVLAHVEQSSPVLRGVFVARRLLCRELPEPPEGVDVNPPATDGAKTTRHRYEALTEAPGTTCAACHKGLVNAAGWAFEHLDWTGRVRTDENGVPVNTAGQLAFGLDVDGPYADVGELGRKLAGSPAARECFARQLYRFGSGRVDHEEDRPAIAALMTGFERGKFSINELLIAYAKSVRFTTRQAN